MFDDLIARNLTPDDDPELWIVATKALFAEASLLAVETKDEVYAQIGCCHHWISPHRPIHWTADGGFAWPFGYDKTTTGPSYRAMPEFSWSESFKWTSSGWEPGQTGRRCLSFRIAIPARTARHLQAAIHTIWTPHSPVSTEKVIKLFGFRNHDGHWTMTASEMLGRNRRSK